MTVVDRSATDADMLTPAQLRAARSIVGWSRDELATKSDTASMTVKAFERSMSDPKLSTLHKWRRALEAAGVEFIEPDHDGGPGVRLKIAKATKGKR